MNDRKTWKAFLLKTLSYVTVAALAAFVTFLLCGQNTKLAQLQRIIQYRFVGDVDVAQMEDEAAAAMVAALDDRWSYYISAQQYESYQNQKTNSYIGVGITILQREDGTGFDILSVSQDGGAEKAGILAGDIIVEAEGQSAAEMDTNELTQIIQGEAGTTVTITVLRGAQRLEFEVTRQRISAQVAVGKMLPERIGYVRIQNFNDHSAQQTIAEVDRLVEEGAKALIFDVRDNSGGYVHEMTQILDHLLPEGVLFRSVPSRGQESVTMSDESCLELPMAVLVNANSYSAAEFFAAALREYDWATVVGEPTVGKGYFQNTFRFTDGSAVGLSVGQYYTPNGVSLAEEGGLVPDVEVLWDEQTLELARTGRLTVEEDPQVLAAIETIRS